MRINTLDYLRGIMAIVIMVYHYFSWTLHPYGSDTLLGIAGIYGVSIFYVLSGLTLYHVYHQSLTFKNTYQFYTKRLFRILPLMWLSILLTVLLIDNSANTETIALNITGLFGFLDHDNYITTGAWSIGNELVFYSIFPVIILCKKWLPFSIEVFFILTLLAGSYFAFFALDNSLSLAEQWSIYINPFNQMFLFVGGMLIAKLFNNYKNNYLSFFLLFGSITLVLIYSIDGDKINIVTGSNRFIFSAVAFSLTLAFLFVKFKPHQLVDQVLSQIGNVSYAVYLMHAIVFCQIAKFINRDQHTGLFLIVSMSTTLVVSWLVYRFYETRFIELGKRVLKKFGNHTKT